MTKTDTKTEAAYRRGDMLEKRAPGLVPDPLIAAAAGRVAEEKSSPLLAAKIADFFLKPRG